MYLYHSFLIGYHFYNSYIYVKWRKQVGLKFKKIQIEFIFIFNIFILFTLLLYYYFIYIVLFDMCFPIHYKRYYFCNHYQKPSIWWELSQFYGINRTLVSKWYKERCQKSKIVCVNSLTQPQQNLKNPEIFQFSF